MQLNTLFFELVRVSLGVQDTLSHTPSSEEWDALFNMAMKQSLVGVCFVGIHTLGADSDDGYAKIGMSEDLFYSWMGIAARINMKNELMDGYSKKALTFFRSNGFACQVLKGQGIAKLYGELQGYRQSGDIDVWLAGGRDKVYQLSRDVFGKITGANYHHIHFPMWDDPEIEAHIYPSFLSSPLRNKRLQEFCIQYEPKEGCEDTPSLAFNRVFIFLHCYRHLSGHGVGMRQLMDYYFVLRAEELSDSSKQQVMKTIDSLGMKRFTHAVMWFMKEVFGLDDEFLICEPNEKDGRFLLREVMMTGNMGHADERVDRSELNTSLGRYIYNIKRDIHVMSICPHESLWEPWFNLILFLRRKYIWSKKYNVE